MPSETFFRLPEEKRRRLLDAAWEEFTRVSFADASINRIIHSAGIPRGSFYQYFEDKRDLFIHLVRPVQQYFFDLAQEEVASVHGDLAAAPLRIYDRFFCSNAQHDSDLMRCTQIMRCNPDSEFQALFLAPDAQIQKIVAIVDTSPLLHRDDAYLRTVLHLFIAILARAIADTLHDTQHKEDIRRQLQLRVEILLNGCCVRT